MLSDVILLAVILSVSIKVETLKYLLVIPSIILSDVILLAVILSVSIKVETLKYLLVRP